MQCGRALLRTSRTHKSIDYTGTINGGAQVESKARYAQRTTLCPHSTRSIENDDDDTAAAKQALETTTTENKSMSKCAAAAASYATHRRILLSFGAGQSLCRRREQHRLHQCISGGSSNSSSTSGTRVHTFHRRLIIVAGRHTYTVRQTNKSLFNPPRGHSSVEAAARGEQLAAAWQWLGSSSSSSRLVMCTRTSRQITPRWRQQLAKKERKSQRRKERGRVIKR